MAARQTEQAESVRTPQAAQVEETAQVSSASPAQQDTQSPPASQTQQTAQVPPDDRGSNGGGNGGADTLAAGDLRVTDEVIAIIAGMAATEVRGVAGMSGGIAGGIAEMLGRKSMAKGVRVEAGEKEAAIDLFIIVEYGHRIPDVAWEIQEKVKEAVEGMTGMQVIEVNIHVQGIRFESDGTRDEAPRGEGGP